MALNKDPERNEKVYFTKYLRDSNDINVFNATGNYSTTSKQFILLNKTVQPMYITNLNIYIQDNGSFIATGYGAGAALTNGIRVYHDSRTSGRSDFTDNINCFSNADLELFAYDKNISTTDFTGGGDNVLTIRWNFLDIASVPVVLQDGDKFVVDLQDNFTGLTSHKFLVQGYVMVESQGKFS